MTTKLLGSVGGLAAGQVASLKWVQTAPSDVQVVTASNLLTSQFARNLVLKRGALTGASTYTFRLYASTAVTPSLSISLSLAL